MFHHCTVEGSRLLFDFFYWLNILAIIEKQGLGPGLAGRISGSVNFYMSSTSSWLFSDDFLDISVRASRGAACPTSRAAACHLDSPSVDPHVHFRALQSSMGAACPYRWQPQAVSRAAACGYQCSLHGGLLGRCRISSSPVAGPFGRAGGIGRRGRLARCLRIHMAVKSSLRDSDGKASSYRDAFGKGRAAAKPVPIETPFGEGRAAAKPVPIETPFGRRQTVVARGSCTLLASG